MQKEHIFLMQIRTQKEENINKMSSSMEEEALSNCVQQYKVLYDKSHKDFHRKDIKKNPWNAVAEELGLEDGAEIQRNPKFRFSFCFCFLSSPSFTSQNNKMCS